MILTQIRITINKFDDETLQPKKPTTLIWDLVVVGLNLESLKKDYQWVSHISYNDNEAFVVGYVLLCQGIDVTMMNINKKLELQDMHNYIRVLIHQ